MCSLEYASDKQSLQSVIELQDEEEVLFNVPMYQRLYVWGDEQIKTLLEDILEAYQKHRGKDEDEIMYIGTVVLDEQHFEDENRVVYDLVDGQQRFTTLWLLSLLFANDSFMGRFTSIPSPETANPLRLTFSIREEVSDFFKFLNDNVGQEDGTISDQSLHQVKNFIVESESPEDLGRDLLIYKDKRIDKIRNGLKVISQVLMEHIRGWDFKKRKGLSQFIFEKVQFVTVKVPDGGNLNQLFETLNNRGEQLLQEDVVKANLLNHIEEEKRNLYNRLWVVCSGMDDYVENNLKAAGIASKDIYDILNEMYSDRGELNTDVFSRESKQSVDGSADSTDLLSILKDDFSISDEVVADKEETEDNTNKDQEDSGPDAEVQSIISFPQLLLHTLRIYDVRYNSSKIDGSESYYPEVNEKRLIQIFQDRIEDEWFKDSLKIEAFIKLLWEVRFIFDNAVVKWVEQGGDRELILQKLEKSDNYLSRVYSPPGEKASRQGLYKLQLLQRMLYHTQDPRKHNWLTPYLYKSLNNQLGVIRFKEKNFQACYDLLEGIDNLMFCTSLQGDRREQTFKLCMNGFDDVMDSEKLSFERYEEILQSGLDTPHYWFYKIDLLLFNQKEEPKGGVGNWYKFKMNSRNSIEHVLPRNAKSKIANNEHEETVINQWIGNLALVSTVDNATYNNGYFSEKKNKYKDINGSVPPSLKLDWMYSDEYQSEQGGLKWEIKEIKKHQQDIRALLREYFRKIADKYSVSEIG